MSFDPITMALCNGGGGSFSLPYIEIGFSDFTETIPTEDGMVMYIGKTKSDELIEAAKSAMPIIVKLDMSAAVNCYLFNYGDGGDGESGMSIYRASEFVSGVGNMAYELSGPHEAMDDCWEFAIHAQTPTE